MWLVVVGDNDVNPFAFEIFNFIICCDATVNCYDKIWSHLSQYLWDESATVFMSVYGTYEIQEIYSFIKFCHQQEIEWEDKSDMGRLNDNDTPKVSVEDMDDFMGGFM